MYCLLQQKTKLSKLSKNKVDSKLKLSTENNENAPFLDHFAKSNNQRNKQE